MENVTTDEMEKLLLLVVMGSWVVNGIREKRLPDFEAAEQKFLDHVLRCGCAQYLEKDTLAGEIFPNRKLDDVMMPYIHEYDEYTFWEELECRLVDRDMLRKYGAAAIKKMTFEERLDNEEEFREKYNHELAENGLEHITFANPGK